MIAWIAIFHWTIGLSFAGVIVTVITYAIRAICAQSDLLDGISTNNTSKVAAILLVNRRFITKKQKDDTTMWLMANGDPLCNDKQIKEQSDY